MVSCLRQAFKCCLTSMSLLEQMKHHDVWVFLEAFETPQNRHSCHVTESTVLPLLEEKTAMTQCLTIRWHASSLFPPLNCLHREYSHVRHSPPSQRLSIDHHREERGVKLASLRSRRQCCCCCCSNLFRRCPTSRARSLARPTCRVDHGPPFELWLVFALWHWVELG